MVVERQVGPVQALGIVTKGFDPESIVTKWDNNGRKDVLVRGSWCRVEVVALKAGGITLKQIDPQARLTIGGLRGVNYSPDGQVRFDSYSDPAESEVLQATMTDPGHMVIMAGHLLRERVDSGLRPFVFKAFAWDLADVPVHAPDRPIEPACGLVYGAGVFSL